MGEAKSQEKFLGGCINFLRTIKSFIAPFCFQKYPKLYVKMGPRAKKNSQSDNRPRAELARFLLKRWRKKFVDTTCNLCWGV